MSNCLAVAVTVELTISAFTNSLQHSGNQHHDPIHPDDPRRKSCMRTPLTMRRCVRDQHDHLRCLSSPHKFRQSRRHTSRDGLRSIPSASSCARTLSAPRCGIHRPPKRVVAAERELTCESPEILLDGLNVRGERVKLVDVARILRRMVSVVHHLHKNHIQLCDPKSRVLFWLSAVINSQLREHRPGHSTLPRLEPYRIWKRHDPGPSGYTSASSQYSQG